MKILAFAASSSRKSINKRLASYAASYFENHESEVLDLNDYEIPLFSEDREAELGQPDQAKAFLKKIAECDALIVSFAEHNGSYSAAYKNLFDWCSRIDTKVFQSKPAVFLSASPGRRGGATVLASATTSAPFYGANLKGSFSLANFYDNFDLENNRIKERQLDANLKTTLSRLLSQELRKPALFH